jgi:hypothetical protein
MEHPAQLEGQRERARYREDRLEILARQGSMHTHPASAPASCPADQAPSPTSSGTLLAETPMPPNFVSMPGFLDRSMPTAEQTTAGTLPRRRTASRAAGRRSA